MGCLVIVVLVAVVITGPVAPVHFNARYHGSACAEEQHHSVIVPCCVSCGTAPYILDHHVGVLYGTNLAIQSGITLEVFLTICPR